MWYLFLSLGFIQFIGSLLYFVFYTDSDSVQTVYALTKILMIALPLWIYFAREDYGFKFPKLRLFEVHRRDVVMQGVVFGLLMSAVILVADVVMQGMLVDFSGNIAQKIQDTGINSYYWSAAFAISIFHSGFEEWFWRWFIVGGLQKRMTEHAAIWVGGGLFALHHYVLISQFFSWELTLFFGTMVGIGGVIWSLLYKKTESLLTPWIAHAFVDFTLFAIGWILVF